MASHKSAKKRIRTTERKKAINKGYESMIKTHYKKVLDSGKKEEAEKLYKEAVAIIDRGTAKGVIHKNTASRKKASLTRHLNKLGTVKEKE